ncbi:MAG TPA: hypothetical protein PLR88_12880 [Bacteroidales bacterium]|nr:hypothetical protein [Bacteroidales bacterium]
MRDTYNFLLRPSGAHGFVWMLTRGGAPGYNISGLRPEVKLYGYLPTHHKRFAEL